VRLAASVNPDAHVRREGVTSTVKQPTYADSLV